MTLPTSTALVHWAKYGEAWPRPIGPVYLYERDAADASTLTRTPTPVTLLQFTQAVSNKQAVLQREIARWALPTYEAREEALGVLDGSKGYLMPLAFLRALNAALMTGNKETQLLHEPYAQCVCWMDLLPKTAFKAGGKYAVVQGDLRYTLMPALAKRKHVSPGATTLSNATFTRLPCIECGFKLEPMVSILGAPAVVWIALHQSYLSRPLIDYCVTHVPALPIVGDLKHVVAAPQDVCKPAGETLAVLVVPRGKVRIAVSAMSALDACQHVHVEAILVGEGARLWSSNMIEVTGDEGNEAWVALVGLGEVRAAIRGDGASHALFYTQSPLQLPPPAAGDAMDIEPPEPAEPVYNVVAPDPFPPNVGGHGWNRQQHAVDTLMTDVPQPMATFEQMNASATRFLDKVSVRDTGVPEAGVLIVHPTLRVEHRFEVTSRRCYVSVSGMTFRVRATAAVAGEEASSVELVLDDVAQALESAGVPGAALSRDDREQLLALKLAKYGPARDDGMGFTHAELHANGAPNKLRFSVGSTPASPVDNVHKRRTFAIRKD